MLSKSKKPKDPRTSKRRGISVRKLSEQEVKIFLVVLSALMAEVPAPKDARKKYLRDVESRLRNNGVAFLSQSRSFPTYGLKLLGQDLQGFPIPGLKKAEGKVYPRLFAWYWAELDRLGKKIKPNSGDALRAQKILCVLSFAKMLKASTVNQIKKSLTDFEERVQPVKEVPIETDNNNSNEKDASPSLGSHSDGVSLDTESITPDPSLFDVLGIDKSLLDSQPRYVDFNSISTKPSALVDPPALPEWFAGQFIRLSKDQEGRTQMYTPTIGLKPPPYGKVSVLTEAAGKLRIIVPYNSPFVHSTGVYSRCRAVLDTLKGDVSQNQKVGHLLVQKFTKKSDKLLSDEFIISADLKSFSDNTRQDKICFGLKELGLAGLDDYLFNLPIVMPNGKIIKPCKLLMGLKGCFELSSVLHNYCVMLVNIINYALCGDDLAYIGRLEPYEKAISAFGWSLNRDKTVVSKTAAVFCGEMYWLGYRVSPRVPKIHSLYRNCKVRGSTALFAVVRDAVASLNTIYTPRGVARITAPLLAVLRSRWKGMVVPTLPNKLRGLGFKNTRRNRGLLSLLNNKSILRIALVSIGIEREQPEMNRWFGLPIQITPDKISNVFADFPALLSKGAIQLYVPKPARAARKDITSLDLCNALEWYYDDTRLNIEMFKKVD